MIVLLPFFSFSFSLTNPHPPHNNTHQQFVMGDLNYRITQLDAQGMVERTALAARQATRILRHNDGDPIGACV